MPIKRSMWVVVAALALTTSTALAAPRDKAAPKKATTEDASKSIPSRSDWQLQMVERIERQKVFPARGYCRDGLVQISFLIDRAGKLLSTEVTESSSVPAFDAEALAMIGRAQPFPAPPADVAGPHVWLTVPIRFNPIPDTSPTDRRSYLQVRSDRTLILDGVSLQQASLEKAVDDATGKDKSIYIAVCGEADIPEDELNRLAERLQSAGFRSTVLPRSGPD